MRSLRCVSNFDKITGKEQLTAVKRAHSEIFFCTQLLFQYKFICLPFSWAKWFSKDSLTYGIVISLLPSIYRLNMTNSFINSNNFYTFDIHIINIGINMYECYILVRHSYLYTVRVLQ